MYAVIMAGGGGTRLHPLSRPDRPKPFLPLLGEHTLLQATAARLPTDDVTVVTDKRYERLVRDQLPDANLLVEPMGRNTAAAIALATVAIDRPDDDVMLVVPADAHIEREDVYRDVLSAAGEHLAPGAFGIDDPLVTLGTQMTRPSTDYGHLLPVLERGAERAEQLFEEEGVAWNAGIFLWRRRAIRAAIQRYSSLLQLLEPAMGAPALLQHAYEQLKPISIDYLVMENAARNGQVVMAAMDVAWSDLGSWTQLLAAIGARGDGAVVQPGETVSVDDDDLVVRRVGGRLGVISPLAGGSMTATQPIAVLRGASADIDRIRALIDRCAEPGG
jgi:mannose-1-phosphate guanylyltransferase